MVTVDVSLWKLSSIAQNLFQQPLEQTTLTCFSTKALSPMIIFQWPHCSRKWTLHLLQTWLQYPKFLNCLAQWLRPKWSASKSQLGCHSFFANETENLLLTEKRFSIWQLSEFMIKESFPLRTLTSQTKEEIKRTEWNILVYKLIWSLLWKLS